MYGIPKNLTVIILWVDVDFKQNTVEAKLVQNLSHVRISLPRLLELVFCFFSLMKPYVNP